MRAIAYAFAVCWGIVGIGLLGPVTIEKAEQLNAGEWASWVQAIGSIIALGVAIFVMSRQNRHAAKLVTQADALALNRRAKTVAVIVGSAHWQISACFNQLQTAISNRDSSDFISTLMSSKHICDEARSKLASIPIHDLGSAKMAEGVIRLQETCGTFANIIAGQQAHPNMPHVEQLVHRMRSNCDGGIAAFRDGMSEIAN